MSPPAKANETFVARLVEQRRRLGLTQTDVANAMRDVGFAWHQTTASRTEDGQRALRLDEAYALASLFAVDLPHVPESAAGICRRCFNQPPPGFMCNACERRTP